MFGGFRGQFAPHIEYIVRKGFRRDVGMSNHYVMGVKRHSRSFCQEAVLGRVVQDGAEFKW